MLLTDADKIRNHLRDVTNNRDSWLFVADSESNHDRLVDIAARLRYRLGVRWSRLCSYGTLGFFNPKVGVATQLSFLSVPRSRMSCRQVNRLLGRKAAGEPSWLLLLLDTLAPATVEEFLAAAAQGKLSEPPDALAN